MAIYSWASANDNIKLDYTPAFDRFSPAYSSIIMFVLESLITSRRDLGFFIKIVSFGAIFITSLMVFIICFGIYALATTDYEVSSLPVVDDYSSNIRHLALFSPHYSSLLGMLSVGFFLHPCSIEIVKNNRNQENNLRDTFLGYLGVFMSYASVGTMGYIGFSGKYFQKYFLEHSGINQVSLFYIILQVCLNMFASSDPIAFIIRAGVFCLLFSTFPLVNHFLRSLVSSLLY